MQYPKEKTLKLAQNTNNNSFCIKFFKANKIFMLKENIQLTVLKC